MHRVVRAENTLRMAAVESKLPFAAPHHSASVLFLSVVCFLAYCDITKSIRLRKTLTHLVLGFTKRPYLHFSTNRLTAIYILTSPSGQYYLILKTNQPKSQPSSSAELFDSRMRAFFASNLASFAIGLLVSTSFSSCSMLHFPNDVKLSPWEIVHPVKGLTKSVKSSDGEEILRIWSSHQGIEVQKVASSQPKMVVVYYHMKSNQGRARVLGCDARISERLGAPHNEYQVYIFGTPPDGHGLPESPSEACKQIKFKAETSGSKKRDRVERDG